MSALRDAVTIRPLQPTDSMEELTRLLHAAYAKLGAMGLNYACVDQPVAATRRCIGSGACLVADSAGLVVGTIVIRPPHADSRCAYYGLPHVASAHQLAVAPSHQGRGVGSRLLQAAEDWARSHGYRELALDTAEPATHLVALYGRGGFNLVDHVQWPGKRYRSVVMAKPLHPPRAIDDGAGSIATSIKGVLLVDGGVVLVRNPRDEWELPGGRAEPGETPESALVREFEEELALRVQVRAPIDTYLFAVAPDRAVRIVTYGCTLAGTFAPRLSDEHSEYRVCPAGDLSTLPLPAGYRQSIETWWSAVR